MIKHFPHIAVGPLDTGWAPRVTIYGHPPPKIPTDLSSQFPRLGEILSTVPERDLYWETWPPSLTAMRWGWARFDQWAQYGQAKFDRLWPPDGDDWVDSLIEVYGSSWHKALLFVTAGDQPEFLGRLQSAFESQESRVGGIYGANHSHAVSIALDYAPWVRTVKRRDWVFPFPNFCSICGTGYYVDTVRYYFLRMWGHTGVCPRCMSVASYGMPATSPMYEGFTLDAALKSLQDLSSVVQAIPPQSFRETFPNPGFDPSIRDKVLAALICVPTASAIRELAGGVSWLNVLQLAGLVGEAWRPSRGTLCTASDGHPCRSLAERSIDDWLTNRGISHRVEPHWPKDAELNPGGKLRADWELCDGTFIEYAGLNSEEYNLRIETKRMLAAKAGLELIVIFPQDLHRLEAKFRRWIK